MKIILFYMEDEYIQVLRLTPEEEAYLMSDELINIPDNRVIDILEKRGLPHNVFDPIWMIPEHEVGVFDEGDEQPVFTI